MGTQPTTPKGAEPHSIFGPRLLWPNGCMDQDATWYGGRPQPTQHCVRCGPSYPQKKGHTHPHPILAHVYCGHMAGWMKTPLGTEADLSPGHIVLDGVPAPAKRAQQPSFRPMSIVAMVAHLSYCWALVIITRTSLQYLHYIKYLPLEHYFEIWNVSKNNVRYFQHMLSYANLSYIN